MDVRSVIYRGVSDTFQIPIDDIRDELTPLEVKNWDSLTQLQLVLQIESTFGIAIEPEDAFRIVSVRSIIDLVRDKLNHASQ